MIRTRRLALMIALLFIAAMSFSVSAQKSEDDYDVKLSGSANYVLTPHFRVHYTLSGEDAVTEDYVDEVVLALEHAWQVQIIEMGWAAPPPDDGKGGDGLYDVYLMDLTEDEALGITYPQDVYGDNPNSPAEEEWSATSYLAVENDFEDYATSPEEVISLMRATVAHEFNHGIQFGYDIADAHDWIYEATAAWIETVTVGEDQDATGYVYEVYRDPALCFGSIAGEYDSSLHYGDWLLIDHLAQEFGTDFVRTLWESVAQVEGFEVWEDLLATRDTDMDILFAGYHLRNLARDYALGDLFRSSVRLTDTITKPNTWSYEANGVQELGVNYLALDVEPGVYSVAVEKDSGRDLTLWALGVKGTAVETFSLEREALIDTSSYDDFYLMVFNPEYDDDLEECDPITYDLLIEPAPGEDGQAFMDQNRFRTFDGSKMRRRITDFEEKLLNTGEWVRR